jgi:hypothetical protein
MNKEKMLVGRMAKLVRPDGSIAAEGEEIRVPAGNPAGFKTGGVADTKALPASAPDTGMETTYPLENGGWIRSPRPAAGAANTPGDLLDFGTAQASLPGPRGNWTLRGYLILLKSDREIMACKAVLTNPEGKTAAQGTLIFIPVKNPEKFRLTVERIN